MSPAPRTRTNGEDRDAPEQQAVPAATVTYAQAVAAGFWGARTDPYDDALYNVKGSVPVSSLASVAPATQVHTIAGAWTVVGTGTFYLADPGDWQLTLQGADGKDLPSSYITVQSGTSLTAHYTGPPPGGAAAVGAGYAELKHGSHIATQLAFTWT